MFDVFGHLYIGNRRRVLLVAVIGAAIAGAFGVGVAKHMSPYGANDPATKRSRRRTGSRPRPAGRSTPGSWRS